MFIVKNRSGKVINLRLGLAFGSAFLIGKTRQVEAFTIDFNYDYDTNYFFTDNPSKDDDDGELYGATRKATLEEAARYFEDYISDTLDAIVVDTNSPTGIGYKFKYQEGEEIKDGFNTWTTSFFNPATGNIETKTDFTLAADTITIFAGGRDLEGSTLGQGGTGWIINTETHPTFGTSEFINLIKARGEAGALLDNPTDIGLWGGSITFDTQTNWENDFNATLEVGEIDFLSVAIHELGHVLGFGGDSWQTNVNQENNTFTGTNAVTSYGDSPVPLYETAHWQEGLTSTAIDGTPDQEVALDPTYNIVNGQGTRKLLTELDYSGLADMGWKVSADALNIQPVPFEFSPGFGILLTCGFFGILKVRNIWKNCK